MRGGEGRVGSGGRGKRPGGLGPGSDFFGLWAGQTVSIDRLVDANSRVKASGSVADLAGPGIGGFLVQVLTAPVAVLADALSFLVSAAWLLRVRVQERTLAAPAGGRNLKREMGEGLRVTFGDRVLRAVACAATYNLFWGAIEAVLILYMVRWLGMSAGEISLTFAVGSTGALVRALATAPAALRFEVGPTIVGSAALSCAALLLIPRQAGRSRDPCC